MNRVMTQTYRFMTDLRGQLEVTQEELANEKVDHEDLKFHLRLTNERLCSEALKKIRLKEELAKAQELCEALKPHKRDWKGHKVKVPPYDGTTEWTLFLQSFRAKSQLAKWSEEEMCLELQVALQGKAARVLADAHLEEGTFEEMVSAVSARFTPEEKVFTYMHDWNQLRQAENEDVDDYAHTFKSLWDKVCPGKSLEADGETQPSNLDKFICGLNDPEMARDVLNKRYQNIEQVIKRVRLLQSTVR
jgi:hypothetical protein